MRSDGRDLDDRCGVGRTGYPFAANMYGVTPDMITTAKALGNGFPCAALMMSDQVAAAVKLEKRLSHGLTLNAAYTFSKSIDDTSAFEPVGTDQNFPQNSYDYHAERALSSFDMRNRLAVAYVWRLPFRNRWLRCG